MTSQTTNSAYNDCKLKILEEPLEDIKLRWDSEGTGSLVYSNVEKKKGPTVQITNYCEKCPKIFIQCSLSTAEEDHNVRGPHFYKLTRDPPYEKQEEFITSEVTQKRNKQFTAIFTGMKITRTLEKDHLSFYQQKLGQHYEDQIQLSSTEIEARVKTINKDEMCLKFEAFVLNEETKEKNYILDSVFSRVIKNTRKGSSKRHSSQNSKQKKIKHCDSGTEPKSHGRGKPYQRTKVREKKYLKEKIPVLENHNNQDVLQHNTTANTEEIHGQELTSIKGPEQEMVTTNGSSLYPLEISDKSLFNLLEIPDENQLFSPYADENVLSLPDVPDDCPYLPSETDYDVYSYRFLSDRNPDNEYEFDSGQTHLPTGSEITVGRNEEGRENITLSTILPDNLFSFVLSELRDMPGVIEYCSKLAQTEAGYNSSQKNIFIVKLVLLLLISLIDMRFGVLLSCFVLYNSPRRINVHLDTFRNTFRTVLIFYAIIFSRLLIFIGFKIIMLVLDKVILRMLSSEKKIKCILTFLKLLMVLYGISGNIFDDRELLKLSEEAKQRRNYLFMFKVSELTELIVLLRGNRHSFEHKYL